MRVTVLRLGHRPERDKRITTHVGLVARAFGAAEMLLAARDGTVVESLKDVVDRWGGDFRIDDGIIWRDEIRRFKESGGKVVHLTMYGSRVDDVVEHIRACEKIMVVVGAEKVPAEIYEMADWNVAIGNQPHSEVAALAVFLDRLFMGKELDRDFGGRLEIIPDARGKVVIGKERREASSFRADVDLE